MDSAKVRPQIQIVLCGPKSSGKTVYITTIFGRAPNVKTGNDRTTQLLQADWKKLESGAAWPAATALGVRELAFSYYSQDFRVDLNINDYDGQLTEVLSQSADDADVAENLSIFRKMVQSASGLIFLFPYGEQVDDDRMRKFRDEINTFLSLVEQGGVNRDALSIPVVIAVNKWDRAPEFGKPGEVDAATEYLNSTPVYRDAVARIRTFLPNHVVIPVSTQRPSEEFNPSRPDIEPHNLLEPLRFIINSVFQRFEEDYANLAGLADEESDKQRFLLLSSYYREIKNYKSYGEEYDRLEKRIADRFEAEFVGYDARKIDERIADESWFFDSIRSEELNRRFDKLRFGALVGKFEEGLNKARGSAEDLEIFRKENDWLFTRLAGHPEHEQAYQAAVARVASVQRAKRLKRIGLVTAAIPVVLFAMWTLSENLVERQRFDEVKALESTPADFAKCERAGRYLADYETGLRPPIYQLDLHLAKARSAESAMHSAVSSKLLERIDFFRTGDADSLAAVVQEANAMMQADERCLPQGQMIGNRSPREELRAIAAELGNAVTFMDRAIAAKAPPDGCPDIVALDAQLPATPGFARDLIEQKVRVQEASLKCDALNSCGDFRSYAQQATGYEEFFKRVFEGDASACLTAEAEGVLPGGLEVALGNDRDQTFTRLDNDNRYKLVTRFTTAQQLDETLALVQDMQAATSQFDGIEGAYSRSAEIDTLLQQSKAAATDYLYTYSITINTILVKANSGTDTYNNPLNIECGNSFYADRSKIELDFAGGFLGRGSCEGSGYSSQLRWIINPYAISAGSGLKLALRRVNPWYNGRSFVMRPQVLTITRDHIYQLKTDGQTTLNVPESSYTVTLYKG
ncbi:hypothetical protein [Hyphomonas sp.]|uniref:hypothetical protein n=1 Tax=Hyphomonas sp. TaxID=87 RepID=UPI0025C21BBD|nr:hypothetical protein [Hyphomonas sp.]